MFSWQIIRTSIKKTVKLILRIQRSIYPDCRFQAAQYYHQHIYIILNSFKNYHQIINQLATIIEIAKLQNMNFIKKTLKFTSKSQVNLSILHNNQDQKIDSKTENILKQLQKQYEQLKFNSKDIYQIPKYYSYLTLLEDFLSNNQLSKSSSINQIIHNLNFKNKKNDKPLSMLSVFSTFSLAQKLKFLIDTLKIIRKNYIILPQQKQNEKQIKSQQSEIIKNQKDFKNQNKINSNEKGKQFQGTQIKKKKKVKKITSIASISLNQLKTLTLSYWTKVDFEFNNPKKQIKVSGKQNFVLDIQNYLIRLSKKQKACFVLQSCNNDQVPGWLKKIYVKLEKDIFSQAFDSIWHLIVQIQLEKMASKFQVAVKSVQNSPAKSKRQDFPEQFSDQFQIQQQKYLVFLTHLTLKNYLSDRDKWILKTKNKQKFTEYKQVEFDGTAQNVLKQKLEKLCFLKGHDQRKNWETYQIKALFNIPSSVIKFKYMNALKQKNKYISSWNVLEKQYQMNIQLVSQTFQFFSLFKEKFHELLKLYEQSRKNLTENKDKISSQSKIRSNLQSKQFTKQQFQNIFKFKQLTLKQQVLDYIKDEKRQILILKSLKQVLKNSLFNFLIVECNKKNQQKSQLIITCQFNKDLIKQNLNKIKIKHFLKEQIEEMNKKLFENFLRQMIMMIFNQFKIYQETQIVNQQQFFTICQSFNDDMDDYGFSSKSIKLNEEQIENINFYSSQRQERKYISQQSLSSQHSSPQKVQDQQNRSSSIVKQVDLQNIPQFSKYNNDEFIQEINVVSPYCKKSKTQQNELTTKSSFQKQNQLEVQFQSKKIQNSSMNQSSYLQNRHNLIPRIKSEKPQILQQNLLAQQWKRLQQGGLVCTNQKKLKQQKLILRRILTKMGQNLLKQKNIMNVSLPVNIFKTQSQLTTMARALTYCPFFLEQPAYINQKNQINYLERMKKLVVNLIADNYTQINFQKPFNPILGQTLQVQIDGCPLYLEQISHHPQISYFYFLGRGYKIYGSVEPKVSMGVNHAKVISGCFKTIQFDDGSFIESGPNRMMVNGTVFGQRTFNIDQKNYIYDMKKNILAVITFGPSKKGFFSSSQQPLDYFCGKIMKVNQNFKVEYKKWRQKPEYIIKKQWIQNQMSSFVGIWNQKIFFDGYQYYNFNEQLPFKMIEEKYPLPSDSRYRQDLQYLIKGDLDQSQQQKQLMQQRQRQDKRLRKWYNK